MKIDSALFARPWEIPELTSMNRLRARPDIIPFNKERMALSRDNTKSPWYLSLDGEWSFSFHNKLDDVKASEIAEATDASNWDKVAVPGDLCTQGYSHPHYTNVNMPFKNDPPFVPDDNPCGIYRRDFTLPEGWENRRTVLHIGSAESSAWVYVNGTLAGMSTDTRLPSEFQITKFLRPGKNTVAILVVRWTASSYLEDQDHWKELGLHRSVYLYSTDHMYLHDIAIDAGYDYKKGDGTLRIKTKVEYDHAPDCHDWRPTVHPGWSVEAKLYDAKGKVVPGIAFKSGIQSYDYRCNMGEFVFEGRVKKADPWSAEVPNLYKVVVTLRDAKGKFVEADCLRIGFRDVHFENRQLLVNGKPVLIRGVNRHEFHEVHCKYVPHETELLDVVTLKQYNFNAVRCCHYPDDSNWLDLCDEYGIYLVDEANIEDHANYATLTHDDAWRHAWFERGSRMVLRDRSHASVIIWSTGNESGIGENHLALIDWMRATDPTRLIHCEGAMHGGWHQGAGIFGSEISHRLTDIINPMYPSITDSVKYAKEVPDDRPFIMCEYSHAMGNSCGSLADYWDAVYNTHGLQGGFIWDWVEQGILCHDKKGRAYWGYGGDFGDHPNDVNFTCNGMVQPDRSPKPQMFDFKHIVQPLKISLKDMRKGLINVKNMDFFRSADWLEATWSVDVDGVQVASGKVEKLDIAPEKVKVIHLLGYDFAKLPRLAKGEEAFLFVTATTRTAQTWAPKGHIVAWQQMELALSVDRKLQLREAESLKNAGAVTLVEENDKPVAVAAGEVVLNLDPDMCRIKSIEANGKTIIVGGPDFTIWRTPTDNEATRAAGLGECAKNMWKAYGRWHRDGFDNVERKSIGFSIAEEGESVIVISRDAYIPHPASKESKVPANAAIEVASEYRVEPNGAILCSHEVSVPQGIDDLPRLAMRLKFANGFDNLSWFGLGPCESYPDRKEGSFVGIFTSDVADQFFPYICPQEHGLHLDTRWMTLSDASGHGLQFQAEGANFGFHATHTPDEVLMKAVHINEVNPDKFTTLYLDIATRGLGTGSCGPDTLAKYRVGPGSYTMTYWVFPI